MITSTVSVRVRRLAAGLLPALGLLGFTSLPAQASIPAPPNAFQTFNEYPVDASSAPFDIITGPDGNIWYTELVNDRVVQANPADGTVLRTVLVGTGLGSCEPTGITIGPDRNIWVACIYGDSLIRITPSSGAQKAYHLPPTTGTVAAGCSCPLYLTSGPDGYLWFTENGPGYVSKLNVTTGSLTRYALPAGIKAYPSGIAVGSDGKLWFTESNISRIGRMTTSGLLTTFAVPTANSTPWAITAAPDGNLYYTEITGNKITRITTSGTTTEIPIPTALSDPHGINVGPDGNLWFTEAHSGNVGSMTTDGSFQEFAIPSGSSSQPNGIATGADGNVWFTELGTNKIGKVGVRHSALSLDKTAIGFGNVDVSTSPAQQTITLTNNGAESQAAFTPSVAGGGASGSFSIAGQTCSAGAIVATASCAADIAFGATTVPGNASARLDFLTDGGTATQQKLSVGLSASVNIPTCKSVTINPSLPSPEVLGQPLGLNATSAGCPDPNPLYEFYLRSPAGVWSIVQPFSTNDVFIWDTTHFTPGTYLTGIWVKDANSTKTYDTYAFGTFTLTFPNCTDAGVSPDSASPQPVGLTVNFTAFADACPNAVYQWWVRNAAGAWSIAVPFPAGNTFAWNTSSLHTGTYQIGVWAKQQGSTRSYDAFAFVTYTLTAAIITGTTNCQAVDVGANPPSPNRPLQDITFTATSYGCDSPQYRWWVRDTSAVWHVVQDYSASSDTFIWSGVSRKPGTYLVGVWARQAGSTASYQSYSFITYALQIEGQPCTSVGISP
ncbi:MAG TPA: hypothetical protein VFD88_06315, partial [Clostridia bacterium]|nr:hypothetical protein [Clostridia bacterium]